MNKPVEKALSNLIPRHPGALPPELVELTRALLVQSRVKASSLKAEEEIARTYVCANIACERLKTTLDLPPIEPRPPIPPRAYKKLYTYFTTLFPVVGPSSSRRKPRTSTALPAPSTPSKTNDYSTQRNKPTKRTTPSLAAASKIRTPRAGLRYANAQQREERVPGWVAPVVRKMCGEMDTRAAIPHVLAGVESILCLPPAAARPEGRIPALVAAVWFFVVQEMTGKRTGKKEFAERRKKILGVFAEVRGGGEVGAKIGEGEDVWRGWEEVGFGDVQTWIVEVTKRDWLEMDWFVNINDPGEDFGEEAMDIDKEEDDWVQTPGRDQMGMGRMMRDEYDYLTAENRDNYERWKKSISRMTS